MLLTRTCGLKRRGRDCSSLQLDIADCAGEAVARLPVSMPGFRDGDVIPRRVPIGIARPPVIA